MFKRESVIILVTGTLIEPYDRNWKECLSTWIPRLRKLGYKVMISIGDENIDNYYKINGNFIYFKTSDTKLGLYDKSINLPIKWILEETDYEYYFRIDSDSFVHPERFDAMMYQNINQFPNMDYMGCCHPFMGWNSHSSDRIIIPQPDNISKNITTNDAIFFASGVAYLVSRRAMKLAHMDMRVLNDYEKACDDFVLGRAMYENRVPLVHDSRILLESKYKRVIEDPDGIGIPYIGDSNSHLAIQHYMDGNMEKAAKDLGWEDDITKKMVIMVTGSNVKPWDENWKECYRTWIPELKKLGYRVLIALGDKNLNSDWVVDGDFITFKAEDTKKGVYDKSIRLPIKWIFKETDYEYYFRIDSDSFVHPQRFDNMVRDNLKDFPELSYMGCCMPWLGWNPHHHNRKWILAKRHFAAGAGYMVSRKAMEIADEKMKIVEEVDYQIDDWVLGRAMWENGVTLLHDSRILFESPYHTSIGDPYNVGTPYIGDKNSHLAIQHYMNGHMNKAMKDLEFVK